MFPELSSEQIAHTVDGLAAATKAASPIAQ
jgi:hypothetical protein